MKDIRKFIIATPEKIFDRAATLFIPNLLLELSVQKLIDRLKVLLKHFMNLTVSSATQYDQVLADFATFYQNELKCAELNSIRLKKIKIVLMIFMLKNYLFYCTKSCSLLSILS